MCLWGRFPKTIDEDLLSGISICARKTTEIDFQPYSVYFKPLMFSSPIFSTPITIDLTILSPVIPKSNVSHLKLRKNPSQIGTRVLMAGFPDDILPVLNINHAIDRKNPDLTPIVNKIDDFSGLMIRSGMIGRQNIINLTDGNRILEIEEFYIDNQMNPGASGGPVINLKGEIVGIIIQRSVTDASSAENPYLKVPSGTTIAISPRNILPMLDFFNK